MSAGEEEREEGRRKRRGRGDEATTPIQGCWLPGLVGGTGWGGNSQLPARSQKTKALRLRLRLKSGLRGNRVCQLASSGTWEAGERFWPLLPNHWGLSGSTDEVSAPPLGGAGQGLGPGCHLAPGRCLCLGSCCPWHWAQAPWSSL